MPRYQGMADRCLTCELIRPRSEAFVSGTSAARAGDTLATENVFSDVAPCRCQPEDMSKSSGVQMANVLRCICYLSSR